MSDPFLPSPPPERPSNPRRTWGWLLLIGGVLTSIISIGAIASSGMLLVAGVMSGGVASEQGQKTANSLVGTLSTGPAFLVLGFVAAIVGLVLLALKPKGN